MAFNQHAQGEFTVDVAGEFHCGPNHESPKVFKFEVDIEYPDGVLDGNGFLLDNLHFKAYFAQLGVVDYSCENLAKKACVELYQSTAGRASSCKVSIWAIANAARIDYKVSKPKEAIARTHWEG